MIIFKDMNTFVLYNSSILYPVSAPFVGWSKVFIIISVNTAKTIKTNTINPYNIYSDSDGVTDSEGAPESESESGENALIDLLSFKVDVTISVGVW